MVHRKSRFYLLAQSVFLALLVSGVVGPQAAQAQTTAVHRINTGGAAYTDTLGRQWAADAFFNTGAAFSVANNIPGPIDSALLQSERWDPAAAPELQYNLPV